MNEFTDRFKSLSNFELLRIVENQADYQPDAVKAAMLELENRSLTDDEKEAAKTELEAEQEKNELKNRRKADVQERIRSGGTSALESINPMNKSLSRPERQIAIITIILGFFTIKKWYNEFALVQYSFTEDSPGWDFSIFFYLLDLVFLPVALLLFWLRKKVGWLLLAIYLGYAAFSQLELLIITWDLEPLGIPAVDSVFSQPSSLSIFLLALFFAGTFWLLNREDLRKLYKVSNKLSLMITSIILLLGVLSTVLSLLR